MWNIATLKHCTHGLLIRSRVRRTDAKILDYSRPTCEERPGTIEAYEQKSCQSPKTDTPLRRYLWAHGLGRAEILALAPSLLLREFSERALVYRVSFATRIELYILVAEIFAIYFDELLISNEQVPLST